VPLNPWKTVTLWHWFKTLPFLLLHVAAIAGVFLVEFHWWAVGLCVGLYVVRAWALTAGYHRYFAHRSYKTSRWFQLVLAFLGGTAVQKGPLWWAGNHRHHHRESDTVYDVHSPYFGGLLWSHVGWFMSGMHEATDHEAIKDFSKYPELRWLDRHYWLPAGVLAVACYLIGGWTGVVYGFCLSTVVLYHCVFCVNSLNHVIGRQRYKTSDQSRNNWFLALITLGEGWHNNHHHYQSSANQGFFWWEIDVTYYVLKCLSWLGFVWELRLPPPEKLYAHLTEIPAPEKSAAARVSEYLPTADSIATAIESTIRPAIVAPANPGS
jgi:stearoyl-CoA desaturase (delta-9 desaturase)